MPMLFTASSVRPQVMEANKDYMGRNVWRQAFGDISMGNQQATTQLSQEYGNAMNQAYLSSIANENAIRASNLGQGYKGLALEQNERTLDDAFESYKANYLSGKEKIDTSSAAAVAEVNKAIDSQATNVAQYSNAMFEFLPYLYEKDSNLFLTDPALKRFTNEDGTLISQDELKSMMFNPDGSLNEIGIDYMNMVQNMGSNDRFGTNTYTNYLTEKNPALLQWLNSVNPYGSGETNGEMFNNILGTSGGEYIMSRESFTDDQFKSLQSDYTKVHDELIAQYNTGHKSEKDATEFMNKQKEAISALITLAENLGVAGNEEVKALIEKVEPNTVKYDSAISDPGKGNNRKNREWATSNALADYEELYDAVMNTYGSTGFENTTERRLRNLGAFSTEYESLNSQNLTDEEYINKARDLLDTYGTFSFDSKLAPEVTPKSANEYYVKLHYSTSSAGNESAWLSFDINDTIDGTGFVSLKSKGLRSDRKATSDTLLSHGKPGYSVEIGRIGTTMVVKYNDKYYKLNEPKTKTTDNQALVAYIRSFE